MRAPLWREIGRARRQIPDPIERDLGAVDAVALDQAGDDGAGALAREHDVALERALGVGMTDQRDLQRGIGAQEPGEIMHVQRVDLFQWLKRMRLQESPISKTGKLALSPEPWFH